MLNCRARQYPTILPRFLKASYIDNCYSRFGIKDYENLNRELNKKAVENAKQNAAMLCEAAGTQLGKIHAVSLNGYNELDNFRINRSWSYSLGSSASEKVVYEVPATLPFTSNASILYRLKD